MRNKKLFLVLFLLFVCFIFIIIANTGCFYNLGKSIGEKLKTQISATSGTNNYNVDATQETAGDIKDSNSSKNTSSDFSSTTTSTKADNQNKNGNWKDEIQISFDMDYRFNISGDISKIIFVAVIPKDYKDRQKIINTEYSIKPERIFNDGPDTYAEFMINNPASNFEINIMDEIILSQYGLDTAFNAENKDFDTENLSSYKIAEKYIESNDEDIKKVARTFEAEEIYSLVQVIYNYVMDNMQWVQYVPEDVGAKAALIEKQGDCTSYSDLFIALLRAYGIPARIIEGYTIDATELSIGHNWVEVYFDDIGWVPFDPTYDDNNGSTSLFNNPDNIYVYFSFKRNDSVIHGFHYFSYNWNGSGSVEVLKNISVN
ncbi:MAG: transglutaminase-like domain-containing protein [Actinobacteria bacterium]|nr:transglutaminase-like domain-containing protein [Actinomycetota bacterium]